MTTETIIDALRAAPQPIERLCTLTGRPPAAVRQTVRRLGRRGFRVANDGGVGRGHRAVYRLVRDPDRPLARTCAWHGCGARLAADNPGHLCRAHRRTRDTLEALSGITEEC